MKRKKSKKACNSYELLSYFLRKNNEEDTKKLLWRKGYRTDH